jgi:hypothetical protein
MAQMEELSFVVDAKPGWGIGVLWRHEAEGGKKTTNHAGRLETEYNHKGQRSIVD